MSRTGRWMVVVVVIFVALGVAFWRQLGDDGTSAEPQHQASAREHRDVDTAEALAGPRAKADLAPCPPPGPDSGPPELRGVTLECAGDGSPVDVARAVEGRATVLNLWAYWCGPCADELPAMAEYQKRLGSAATVLTVHQDENETAALERLAELGVRLPTVQDGQRRVAAALQVPNVMPATVVLRSDGTVAKILPRSFASADEIAAAVNPLIGVRG